ncbi:hypothetical protein MOO44_01215 (plasmid) [Nicoliella spurrieriana]|uniref:Uncharacterized protein n=1 Tax=Nicoliella spurrieriana TaxID=2925830 RepID=A0A976RQG4_9LACO|nr:hypothetical protein [Nicoliella spurrieriana]UQS85969.1 hypothetical protein MOO44_01215 [Nicoliella spurrieriana]
MNQDQAALTKIKELSNQAQKNDETKNYYSDDVKIYTNFLELWSDEQKHDQFAESDQKLISTYLAALNDKFIPEYQAALNHFDEDLNLQSAELLHLTPKDNKANLKDYIEIEQFFNNQLTPNAVIDDLKNVDQPVANLVKNHELPEYAKQLDWMALYLLINAIAYHHWFNK